MPSSAQLDDPRVFGGPVAPVAAAARGARRFRVVHVITRLELGGAQQNTLYCTTHHDRGRFEVGLVAGAGGALDQEARAISDARIELVPYLKHPISPWWDLVALVRLRALLRGLRADVVHTHSSKAGIVGRLAAFLAGVPVIVHTVHGWSFNPTQPRWKQHVYAALERMLAPLTDRWIVVAEHDRAQGLERGIGRHEDYEVLRSGIEIEGFVVPGSPRPEVRRALGFDDRHVVVGTVACLKPQKAPLDFVRAAASAHRRDDRLRFFIAGDGELAPQVRAAIRAAGLEGVVRLLGWRRDVADLLHAADVFLLTSLFEGLPRAVLQAMAAGVPVVATAVNGTPEVVEHRHTGMLVPPSRPEAAAAAVLALAADPGLRRRLAAAARRRLTREFDLGAMRERLDRLYLGLLHAGSP